MLPLSPHLLLLSAHKCQATLMLSRPRDLSELTHPRCVP